MRDLSMVFLVVTTLLVAYVYLGYPLLLYALVKVRGEDSRNESLKPETATTFPLVSMVIPAYNEEKVIADKIRNCLDLDYPDSALEIVVVSDGSNDATERVAREAAGQRVKLVFREDRQGKTACINEVLPQLTGEIVVFTDANAYFDRDALRKLVTPLGDREVGCVMGELRYLRGNSLNSKMGEGLYWRYENFIKVQESRLGSTIVGNGAIYAVRRGLLRPLPRSLEADVANPLLALKGGYRVILESRARCVEKAASTVREEFHRKSRIITNQLATYLYGWREFRPLPWAAVLQIVSHKLLRWLVPGFLCVFFLASLGVDQSLLRATLVAGQIVFYGLALGGWWQETSNQRVSRLPFLPYYFCAVNVASVKGMLDFGRGRSVAVWEKADSTRTVENDVNHQNLNSKKEKGG